MSLLLSDETLRERRAVARGPLAALAVSLRADLEPLLSSGPDIPREKALLSRTGGRCPADGSLLAFDPYDPRHRCPTCGIEVTGELHDRFRPYWSHLWLAERALHCALLGVLLGDEPCVAMAGRVLDGYAEHYLHYPNRDNVLGPSRPFFSTYLESIWLLQLMNALDLLEMADAKAAMPLSARVRDRIIEPSISLIESYDEGSSNRQVWNGVAMLAGGVMLGRPDLVERALLGPSGLQAQLDGALLADGSWYEGENYHLFAHRGLWYGVTLAERLSHALPPRLTWRFAEGFAAPIRTLLPDLTFPSRRDSQYAVSVRQPRFAESCELGLARTGDERLAGMLARLYAPDIPRRSIGRAASTADVERNVSGTSLTRADLSWRSLLFALPDLPASSTPPLASELLDAQGFAAIRRERGRVFVGMDYGHSGGGHGHPDRLNLLLSDGGTRWFDDPGTGSYVDDTLRWYRSTLAHVAPMLDGRSQPRVHGSLIAFSDDGVGGWVRAEAPLGEDTVVTRTIVVMGDYLVDQVAWVGDGARELTLPLHGTVVMSAGDCPAQAIPAIIPGGDGPEDGFAFLRQTAAIDVGRASVVRLAGVAGGRGDPESRLDGWLSAPGATWWGAVAPGAPQQPERPLTLVRVVGGRGAITSVWSWRGVVSGMVMRPDSIVVARGDGSVHEHRPRDDGWLVDVVGAAGRTRIELAVGRDRPDPPIDVPPAIESGVIAISEPAPSSMRLPATITLGQAHYRRSEQTWAEAGSPTARVTVVRDDADLVIRVEVPRSHRLFVPVEAENPFDNEPAATNGDGLQLYVRTGGRSAGWLLVPRPESDAVGVRPVESWSRELEVIARWHREGDGYEVVARVPGGCADEPALDVVVNETVSGRQRRRGQLVLSGGEGEFVYLRGDRHDPSRLLRFSLDDD